MNKSNKRYSIAISQMTVTSDDGHFLLVPRAIRIEQVNAHDRLSLETSSRANERE